MSVEMRRGGLVFRLNDATISELQSIETAALELALELEGLAPEDFDRVKHIFDRFFSVLGRVNENLILVDVGFRPEGALAPHRRMQ
jgi:hypothetical protein